MGDKVEFTAEEKAILGENDSAGAPESPEKTEPIPEPKEKEEETGDISVLDELLEPEPDEGGEDEDEIIPEDGKIPYTRFAKVYAKIKELERKNDLLRRDPEAYSRLYPDEKPEPKRDTAPSDTIRMDDLDNLKVQGGTFDGLTLAEVRQQDPAAAAQLESAYVRQNLPLIVRSQVQDALKSSQQESELAKHKEESAKEIEDFISARSEEYFRKSFDKLSQIETKKLEKLVDQCISWGAKTKRGAGKIEDIYYLMTREKQISKAKAAGASAVIDAATKGAKVKSIKSAAGEPPSGAGFDKLMDLSDSQAAKEIENMPDKKFSELMKTGSKELRAKYPGWPWQ